MSSAGNLNFGMRQSLNSAGKISSGGTLTFEQAAAQFSNSGQIAAAGSDQRTRRYNQQQWRSDRNCHCWRRKHHAGQRRIP
ncbi:hypothetical protein [Massilia eburnea]|uniref:hypothetical protein n=1 Tax=Massilia eburnea TaxID=1776165 RepID=UPI003D6A36D7